MRLSKQTEVAIDALVYMGRRGEQVTAQEVDAAIGRIGKGKTMKTSITNAIAAEAKANMDALVAKGQGMNFQGPEGNALMRAWENENEIMEAAKRIERCIERAKRDLDEALEYVQTNHPRGLNPCGILKGTNQKLDRAVAELRICLGDRKWYAELLG